MVPAKPAEVFDRSHEWADLGRFLDQSSPPLGIVWGGRRVGKSFLLSALCESVGGVYIQAIRTDAVLFRASLGVVLAKRLGLPAPLSLEDWPTAIAALFDLPDTPLIVLDEFPYLVESSPELPTVVQAEVDRRARQRSGPKLILCGSAVSQMTGLLRQDGPLYRRASLSMALRPFDLWTNARYWKIEQRPTDALTHRAIIGGLPGYRDVLGDVGDDLNEWVVEHVLDPTRSTFHEDELVFAEDPTLPDANVYRSILAAIAGGERTPGGVAKVTGRKATSLTRPIDRLVEAGLVVRTPDPLRSKRALLDMGDPFLRFHYAVIRPNHAALARRRASEVWERAAPTFHSQVLGPQFEVICREALYDVDLGVGPVAAVGATTLHDPAQNVTFEVDIIGTDDRGRVCLLGEVKASEKPRDLSDLARLDRLRELLSPKLRAPEVQLCLFTLTPVEAKLRQVADERPDVTVLDANALLEAGL